MKRFTRETFCCVSCRMEGIYLRTVALRVASVLGFKRYIHMGEVTRIESYVGK